MGEPICFDCKLKELTIQGYKEIISKLQEIGFQKDEEIKKLKIRAAKNVILISEIDNLNEKYKEEKRKNRELKIDNIQLSKGYNQLNKKYEKRKNEEIITEEKVTLTVNATEKESSESNVSTSTPSQESITVAANPTNVKCNLKDDESLKNEEIMTEEKVTSTVNAIEQESSDGESDTNSSTASQHESITVAADPADVNCNSKDDKCLKKLEICSAENDHEIAEVDAYDEVQRITCLVRTYTHGTITLEI